MFNLEKETLLAQHHSQTLHQEAEQSRLAAQSRKSRLFLTLLAVIGSAFLIVGRKLVSWAGQPAPRKPAPPITQSYRARHSR